MTEIHFKLRGPVRDLVEFVTVITGYNTIYTTAMDHFKRGHNGAACFMDAPLD